jgi:DNA-binding transcriptional MerR regulator
MPNIPKENLKRYYTIGEVAKMFDVSKSLLRFWESEFDLLRPHKNSKGDRRFTPQNLEQLQVIYNLVQERGFTISGARDEIARQRRYEKEKTEMLQRLKRLRDRLEGWRDRL